MTFFKRLSEWFDYEARIAKLEEWTHPPIAPGGTTELKEEIQELRERIQKLESK